MKLFDDDECHWIFLTGSSDDRGVRVYNTSRYFDMSDVEASLGETDIERVPCSTLQDSPRDAFCQTWSLVAAYAHRHGETLDRKLFGDVVARLWRMAYVRRRVLCEVDME